MSILSFRHETRPAQSLPWKRRVLSLLLGLASAIPIAETAAAIELPKCGDPGVVTTAIQAIGKSGRLDDNFFGKKVHYDYSIDTIITEGPTDNQRGWRCTGIGHLAVAGDGESQRTISALEQNGLLPANWQFPEENLAYTVQLTDDESQYIVQVWRNK